MQALVAAFAVVVVVVNPLHLAIQTTLQHSVTMKWATVIMLSRSAIATLPSRGVLYQWSQPSMFLTVVNLKVPLTTNHLWQVPTHNTLPSKHLKGQMTHASADAADASLVQRQLILCVASHNWTTSNSMTQCWPSFLALANIILSFLAGWTDLLHLPSRCWKSPPHTLPRSPSPPPTLSSGCPALALLKLFTQASWLKGIDWLGQ